MFRFRPLLARTLPDRTPRPLLVRPLLARTLLPILLAGAPPGATAALAFDEAQQLARQSAPVLRAQQASVEG